MDGNDHDGSLDPDKFEVFWLFWCHLQSPLIPPEADQTRRTEDKWESDTVLDSLPFIIK